MPTRKAPSPEEAKKMFQHYPYKKLSSWADDWGVTVERVRQIKIECGVGSKFDINMDIATRIASKIKKGQYTLTDIELYKDFPIGREAFATWMRKSPDIKKIIETAQEEAKLNKLNPTTKICKKCNKSQDIDMYSKSQRYVDGRLPWCFDCLNVQLHNKRDNKKRCMLCRKEKSVKSYTSNKKYKDGLVPFCKTCKSKQRRAKRALTTKVTDTIN